MELDGAPAGLPGADQPHADPVGAAYRAEPGDLGSTCCWPPRSTALPGSPGAFGRRVLQQTARHCTAPAHRGRAGRLQ
ncbi:hypothetical protein QJS66_01360 [Kocuria rhizophila]|nr:hypothetical protein QJS66_01360 [Kocuria rhizophila]